MEGPGQQQENFYSIGEQRKELRRTLRSLGVLPAEVLGGEDKDQGDITGIEKVREKTERLFRKINERAKSFKLSDFGYKRLEDRKEGEKNSGISMSKKRLREDREALNKVDVDSVSEQFGKNERNIFKQIASIEKEINILNDQRNKRIYFLKTSGLIQELNNDELLQTINTEISSLEQKIVKLSLDNPSASRANKLISYKEGLSREGHIAETPSVKEIKEKLETALLIGAPTLLWGPTGTGKTSIARKVAYDLTGKIPEEVSCNPETKQSDIYGKQGLRAGREGGTETVDIYGPLTKAMKYGNVCIFDEFTALAPSQAVFIKGILSKRVGDKVNIPGNGEITIRPGFQLIFTANLKSDKNSERQEMPPELKNEFGQNNIYVGYQSKSESYDIMISRLLNKDGSVDFSLYDLEITLPQLVSAIEEVQEAYNKPLRVEQSTELVVTYSPNKPPQLKKMVLNQRTIFHIIESFKIAKLQNTDLSFREHLDQRLKKELTFKEYDENDRILVAKILASKGLLTTLTESELDLPDGTLSFNMANVFKTRKDEEVLKSKEARHIPLKELVDVDPFGQMSIDISAEADRLNKSDQQQKPEAEYKAEISGLNIEKSINTFKNFYSHHNIFLPLDFESKAKEIWTRNKDQIEQYIKSEGYNQILIIPEILLDTETLHTKMTEGYNPTYLGDNFKNGGSFAGSTTQSQRFKILLVHSQTELTGLPILNSTLNTTPDQFKQTGKKGLSLQEYLILQRYIFDSTKTHIDSVKWTWLPKTLSGQNLVWSGFDPAGGGLGVVANPASSRDGNGGFRLSRSFF
jgi:MoxR-like ATPase